LVSIAILGGGSAPLTGDLSGAEENVLPGAASSFYGYITGSLDSIDFQTVVLKCKE
jgi:hypothetical protein